MSYKCMIPFLLSFLIFLISCNPKPREFNDKTKGSGNDTIPAKTDKTRTDDFKDSLAGNNNSKMVDFNKPLAEMNAIFHKYIISGDADFDFVSLMNAHHKAAVDMALIYKANGNDEANGKLADNIITNHQKELSEMGDWLGKRLPPEINPQGKYKADMDSAVNTAMKMSTKMTTNIDKDFAETILAHHQNAITFVNIETEFGKDSKIKSLAKRIKDNDEKDIKVIQEWLKNKK